MPSLEASLDAAWEALAAPAVNEPPERFDIASLDPLPTAARRWLRRAIPNGTELLGGVEVEMSGEIKLGPRWFPFTATEILRAGVGFVWRPIVGGRVLRFVGADVLTPTDARMQFRLHGVIPIVSAAGPDVRRSAEGRLAAETVAWLPHACTPQLGARWRGDGPDDDRAVVSLDIDGRSHDVEVFVDGDGRVTDIGLARWNSSLKPPAAAPFGGRTTTEHVAADDVRVSGGGVVGWSWHTPEQADGEFFRYRVTGLRFVR